MRWLDDFRGKRVLVTGASSGIGRATALAFAAAGSDVALVARRAEALAQVASEARDAGGLTVVVPADVTRREAVRACFDTAYERLGGLDIVVNNAGVLIPGRVTELAADELRKMLDVNLFGALFVMQEAVARLRGRDGTIVNVASLAGRRGVSPLGGYCATKFALVGLTEALRTELRDEHVHVALVEPGVIETPMVERAASDPSIRDIWPAGLYMPTSWVVWAIFAAIRLRLVEVSVPPGAAILEKLAALAPGAADELVHWMTRVSHWLSAKHGDA